jgi:hypothetical protein
MGQEHPTLYTSEKDLDSMTFRKYLTLAAAALLPALAACDQPSAPSALTPEKTQPTSVIDPATGEPVAINYPSNPTYADFPSGEAAPLQVVLPPPGCDPSYEFCEPEPCDPAVDYGCQPCDPTNPSHWCYCEPGLITAIRTQRSGSEPNNSAEVSSLAGPTCNRQVVTGIGARIVEDSDYSTLHVEYRQPYSNGTLGPRVIYKSGPSPNSTVEAWASVPDGYAIVGVKVGQGGTHDMRTLIVDYRAFQLTASGVRMQGPIYTINAGVAPYGSTNVSYTTYSDTEVFSGIGLRSAVQQTKTMISYLGQLP